MQIKYASRHVARGEGKEAREETWKGSPVLLEGFLSQTSRRRTTHFLTYQNDQRRFPRRQRRGRARRISSISFLKKARTRQWGCYTRPELFGTLEIACDVMKNSGGDWFGFKCLPICKCYRLVSFPLNYYDRQLLFPCCDMYGERGRRRRGRARKPDFMQV